MQRKKSAINLIYLLIFLFTGVSIANSSDLISGVEEIVAKMVPKLDKKKIVIGPIYTDNNKQTCTLSDEIIDLIYIELVNSNIIANKSQNNDNIMFRLESSNFDFSMANLDGLVHDDVDAMIIGTIGDNAINEYLLKLKAYYVKSGKLITGGTSYISSESSFATQLRDCLGSDNPYDVLHPDRAQYEKRGISGSYGFLPGDNVTVYSMQYENKISNYLSFFSSYSSLDLEGENDRNTSKTTGSLIMVNLRYYPFYHGKGLRGFFIGSGISFGNLEDSIILKSTGERDEDHGSGVYNAQLEFGRKVSFGKNMFTEINVMIYLYSEIYNLDTGGWIRLSLGAMW